MRGCAWSGSATTGACCRRRCRPNGWRSTCAPSGGAEAPGARGPAWRFVWTHHHAILDGWSLPILFRELFTCYAAELQGAEPELPPARPYRDYIAWLQAQDL